MKSVSFGINDGEKGRGEETVSGTVCTNGRRKVA